MAEEMTFHVPSVSCNHCVEAIRGGVSAVPGVESVETDLDTKLVRVSGDALDAAALRAAIDEAGYEAE